jgi:DNA-binding transcriptional MerR regulator
MRIAALSSTTGVSVATLKFYLREGLLHPGVATAVNQADYDDGHVRRVRLIRALVDLGRLTIADAAKVLAAVDDEDLSIHQAFGVAQDAMVPRRERDDPLHGQALAEVDRLIERNGLRVRPDAEVRHMLADALVTLGRFDVLGEEATATEVLDGQLLDSFVASAVASAEFEIGYVPERDERSDQMTVTVVGTIAWEVAIAAIRRMALEHASAGRFEPAVAPRRRRAGQ